MKNFILIAFISFVCFSIKAQNKFPTHKNTHVTIDGGYIKLIKPSTSGGWARGFFNIDDSTNNFIGGVGLLGSGNNVRHYYMAHGKAPWSSGKGIYVKTNGRVGIGTTAPKSKLEIKGHTTIDGGYINLIKPNTTGGWARGFFNSDSANSFIGGVGLLGSGNNVRHYYVAHGKAPWSSGKGIYVKTNGNVGIGTTSPDSKLTVAGKIKSREVEVTVNAGADFVFDESYDLKEIEEVEAFIKENKHLPEIAPANQMEAEGINLSEMNIKLLQKIEELTLYLINQNKILKMQADKINNLENEIKEVKETSAN